MSAERAVELVAKLVAGDTVTGDMVALCLEPGIGIGLCPLGATEPVAIATDDVAAAVRDVEEAMHPRWVVWSNAPAVHLVGQGLRLARCWDVSAAQRLLMGGWRTDPAKIWAQLHGLPTDSLPTVAPLDLFNQVDELNASELDEPVRADGHLRPEWLADGFAWTPLRLARFAALACEAVRLQLHRLAALRDHPAATATARSESTAELLCAELGFDGLPVDRAIAERIIADLVGPRPRTPAEADAQRAARDAEVLRHSPLGAGFDLRNPATVRSLLRSVGVEVSDTRAWRLEALREAHPLVDALLTWRKAERVSTTYGYSWLDEHVGADGRLRGSWTGCDGAAGRMTATAGLHNMPAHLRPAVTAEPGHVFVRADLGQIEPRVLAAVSGDAALARAAQQDDMYAPVASQLGVDRATAKVAVLGAMYGQTTGQGARALAGLQGAYPVAMAYLEAADLAGRVAGELRTYGGRLIPMGSTNVDAMTDGDARSRSAARGRYARNAMVQGAAAELFKIWAVTVRARVSALDARIVLCLHDELLVHTPVEHAGEVARLVNDCLAESAHRWPAGRTVRFVAEVGVIERWSDAKA